MRLVLVVNASASSVTPRNQAVVTEALAAHHGLETVLTTGRGHATDLAREAAGRGADCVVVLGGDGTLNEAANGVAGTSTALGVLPGGSTNVFARTLGTPNDPVRATGPLLAALARRSIERVGLGRAGGRYFLFHVGLGFDAAVVEQVERRAHLKRRLGHAFFVAAGLSTYARHFDRRRPAVRIEAPGGPPVDDAYLAVCLNTSPYTFLGSRPLDIAAGSGLDRRLTVVAVRTMAVGPLLAVVVAALGLGRRPLHEHPDVVCRGDVERATARACGPPFPYQMDGDFMGRAQDLHVSYQPGSLDLVMPVGAT